MEAFKVTSLSFTYPNSEKKALDDINLSISEGEFVSICGVSGCGKTTLLRHLKPELAPFGAREGTIYFFGEPVFTADKERRFIKIGYVLQDIENQVVTDKVWHEMAFGLENLGLDDNTIRLRTAEIASFFGIGEWFYKDVFKLSGGQKQLLSLAAVMCMQPDVLILDEPTAQLDPIASAEFLNTVKRINDELGITVIITEHRLEEVLPMSDRAVLMEDGKIIADGTPRQIGEALKAKNHKMYRSMPAPMRIHAEVEGGGGSPITVKEGRQWLRSRGFKGSVEGQSPKALGDTAIWLKDIWFRYDKREEDVLKGLCLSAKKGGIYALVGGNAAGKTTTLLVMADVLKPYRGSVKKSGKASMLPQNPKALFTEKTVMLELLSVDNNRDKVYETACLMEIEGLFDRHPYDLSGGEQQRAAIAKILLTGPEILLLDEPTKGMDAYFKEGFANILKKLAGQGKTIIMASHDIEFCAAHADSCALIFCGEVASEGAPRAFFSGNTFYTTAANRMSRGMIQGAILAEDVIRICGKK